MKKQTLLAASAVLATLLLFLNACGKDTPQPIKRTEIKNAALAAALKAKGYTLEGNMLVMNEKAMTTTTLNLSGSKLTDVSGLEAFPKLEEVNLAGNALGPAFDFAPLPPTIKRVNLADNEIYDYLNLAATDYEKGEYKLIRPLDKLTLPITAKYNMDALPAFLKTAPQCDMRMITCGDGDVCKLEKYNTLREVPDKILRELLKNTFPEVFAGDKMDISKALIKSDNTPLQINPSMNIKSLEGMEYIINNQQYSGIIFIEQVKENRSNIPYLKPSEKIERLWLSHVNTPILDLSVAKKLHILNLSYNHAIKSIDLSKTIILQRKEKGYDAYNPDMLILADCPKLTELKMPEAKNATLYTLQLIALPLLKTTFDMSAYDVMSEIALAKLPLCTLTMPTPKQWLGNGEIDNKKGTITFNITEDIYKKAEVKEFVTKYKKEGRLTFTRNFFRHFELTLKDFAWWKINTKTVRSAEMIFSDIKNIEINKQHNTPREVMLRIIENEKSR